MIDHGSNFGGPLPLHATLGAASEGPSHFLTQLLVKCCLDSFNNRCLRGVQVPTCLGGVNIGGLNDDHGALHEAGDLVPRGEDDGLVILRREQQLAAQRRLRLLLLDESYRIPRDVDYVLDGLLDLACIAIGIQQLLFLMMIRQVLISELVKEHDIG